MLEFAAIMGWGCALVATIVARSESRRADRLQADLLAAIRAFEKMMKDRQEQDQ